MANSKKLSLFGKEGSGSIGLTDISTNAKSLNLFSVISDPKDSDMVMEVYHGHGRLCASTGAGNYNQGASGCTWNATFNPDNGNYLFTNESHNNFVRDSHYLGNDTWITF